MGNRMRIVSKEEVSNVYNSISASGIKVDFDELMRLKFWVEGEKQKLDRELKSKYGDSFKANGREDCLTAFRDLGFEYKYHSVSVDFLEKFGKENGIIEVVDPIIKMRKMIRLNSMVNGILEDFPADGVFHPVFTLGNCETGRIYSKDPNVMGWGVEIRYCVKADKGRKILVADWKSQELRILAALSKDKVWMDFLELDDDPHAFTYSEITGKLCDSEEKRNKGKTINFAIVYGIKSTGLANKLGVSEEKAEKIIAKYFKNHPNTKNYIDMVVAEARKNGYVRTYYGSERRLKKDLHDTEKMDRQAINTVIQGTAADMMKNSIVKIFNSLKDNRVDAKILCTVFDSVVIDVLENDLVKLYEVLKDSMEFDFEGVKMKVDMKLGDSWGETMTGRRSRV